jgi:hypothetical protein
VKALAESSMPKLITQGIGGQDNPASGRGNSQLVTAGIVPLRRSDQLIAAEATSFMINERSGCRTHAQSDRYQEIGLGIDIATGVGNWQPDNFRRQTHGAGGMVGSSRSTLKLRLQFDLTRHQDCGADTGRIRDERSGMRPGGVENP